MMYAAGRKLFIGFCALLLSACASRMMDSDATQCAFPDSPRTAAPAFICAPDITGFPVTALRSSASSDASISERIQAELDTQILLWAQQWSVQWYPESNHQQAPNSWLLSYLKKEARVVRSRTSPKEVLWLLFGVPDELNDIQAQYEASVAP